MLITGIKKFIKDLKTGVSRQKKEWQNWKIVHLRLSNHRNRKKKKKENEQNLRDLWDHIKQTNIHMRESQKERRNRKRQKGHMKTSWPETCQIWWKSLIYIFKKLKKEKNKTKHPKRDKLKELHTSTHHKQTV